MTYKVIRRNLQQLSKYKREDALIESNLTLSKARTLLLKQYNNLLNSDTTSFKSWKEVIEKDIQFKTISDVTEIRTFRSGNEIYKIIEY